MSNTVTQLDSLSFPLHGSRLIEASAGTGKTFTLALLYVRLILGEGLQGNGFTRPLTPKEILVVTFTNMAAGELRERIRARLVEAARYFHHSDLQEDAFLVALRAQYAEEQWLECGFRLEMAAESMDEAAISTIHSWCNRVLVEHSFHTRGLFNRELVTDTSDLFTEVVQDYWRTRFYAFNDTQAAALLGAIGSYATFEATLKNLVRPTVHGISVEGTPLSADEHTLEQTLSDIAAAKAEKIAAEEALKNAWQSDWHDVVAELNELRPHLHGGAFRGTKPQDKFDQLLAAVRQWLDGQGALPKEILKYRIGEFKFIQSAPRDERPLRVFALTKTLFELQERPAPPLEAIVYAEAREWVARTFEQRLAAHTQMRHDDLLVQLNRALDPKEAGDNAKLLAGTLREHYPVAMIDEFQDTDPIQFEIFDRVYQVADNANDSGIFMIGDPKQSIYAFRGADINVYLAARQATTGRHYTLKKNFRSTEGVVAACNAFFMHAEQHDQGAFQYQQNGNNPIPYVKVDAQGQKEQLFLQQQPAHPMTLWYLNNPDDPSKPIGTVAFRNEAAQRAASQIAQWLIDANKGNTGFGVNGVEKPLAPQDIAILVRGRQEADLMGKALSERNIASVYLSDRNQLFATQEAQDMVHWLRAVAEPHNEDLVKAALGTSTMALPINTFIHWQNDELAWEQEVVRFAELHRIWQRQGVLVMLQRLLLMYDLSARLLAQSQGERSLTNLLHLAEWLQRAASHIDGQQALIRHLIDSLTSTDEEHILRLESDADRVKIITIHKSKGLQFPLVLLPFISTFKDITNRQKDINIDVDGSNYANFVGNSTVLKEANAARIKEDLRLLYVALTRAIYGLWLGLAPLGTSRHVHTEKSALGYVLNGSGKFASPAAHHEAVEQLANYPGIYVAPMPEACATKAPSPTTTLLAEARTAPKLGNLSNWWITSYSALPLGAAHTLHSPDTAREDQLLEHADEPLDDTPSDALMHQFPRGPKWGTFLHSVLEWAAVATNAQGEEGFAVAAHADAERLAYLSKRCTLRNISEQATALSHWLKQFLTTPWQATGFALADLTPDKTAIELEFLFENHHVSTKQLDQIISRHALSGLTAPKLEASTINGMLKGFIDLVAEHNGRYYVVDWKSNYLGPNDDAYSTTAMRNAIAKHRYDLQYCLYLLALHRLLKARLPNYHYDTHVGGAVYVFLRGMENPESQGIYHDKPPFAVIEALDQLFSGISKEARHA